MDWRNGRWAAVRRAYSGICRLNVVFCVLWTRRVLIFPRCNLRGRWATVLLNALHVPKQLSQKLVFSPAGWPVRLPRIHPNTETWCQRKRRWTDESSTSDANDTEVSGTASCRGAETGRREAGAGREGGSIDPARWRRTRSSTRSQATIRTQQTNTAKTCSTTQTQMSEARFQVTSNQRNGILCAFWKKKNVSNNEPFLNTKALEGQIQFSQNTRQAWKVEVVLGLPNTKEMKECSRRQIRFSVC